MPLLYHIIPLIRSLGLNWHFEFMVAPLQVERHLRLSLMFSSLMPQKGLVCVMQRSFPSLASKLSFSP